MILKEFTTHNGTKFAKLTSALNERHIKIDWDSMNGKKAVQVRARAMKTMNESTETARRLSMSMVVESIDIWMADNIQPDLTEAVDDDSVEEAKVIIAAKDISDKIQGMIEDVAQMQVQDLLPIVDSMRAELGTEEATSFNNSADAALGALLEKLKGTKEEYDNAISAAQGEAQDVDMDMDMSDIDEIDPDMDDETDMDMDMDPAADLDLDDDFDLDMDDDIDAGRELK